MKPTIYVDLDGMAADLLSTMIRYWNRAYGTEYTTASVWDAPAVVKHLDECLVRSGIFKHLDVIPGFDAALMELQQLGHVIIASAPSRNPDSATDKVRWVLERFPSIKRQDIILIKHKHLLRGEVFLDDWKDNITAIRRTNPMAMIGAIAYPYNREVEEDLDCRAEGFLDTRKAWETLVAWVREGLSERGLL